MTIGQTGKRAKNFGQYRQSQYQLDYSQADTSPLTPPRRRQAHRQAQTTSQHTHDESASQQTSVSTPTAGIQRSSTSVDEPAQTQALSRGDIVQREEVEMIESQNSGDDFVQAVADSVFKLMLADVKKDRERNGGRFR